MPDQEPDPRIPPQVQDRRVRPTGVLPKNTQAWVIAGLSLIMIAVIAFSGRNQPKEKAVALPESPAAETNAARIQEYEARLKEEAQRLETAKTELAHTERAFGVAPGALSSGSVTPGIVSEVRSEESPLASDRRKREEQSLFASNVALTFRKETGPATTTALPTPAEVVAKALSAYAPAGAAAATPTASPTVEVGLATKADVDDREKKARDAKRDLELDQAEGQRYRLFEGTLLETVLTNRLDGSFSGPVNCMVTTAVYSQNGQHLLIPQGTRVLGEVRKVETFGEQRLAVTFHRLIMPDGYSVSLDKLHGLNQIGETGLQDQVNHHYTQVFGVSLAIGAIAGLSQANTSTGLNQSGEDAYRQGVATSLSQSSLRILDRYLNVLPTFTIREGHRVKVYLSDDLLLPAYKKHQIPSDL